MFIDKSALMSFGDVIFFFFFYSKIGPLINLCLPQSQTIDEAKKMCWRKSYLKRRERKSYTNSMAMTSRRKRMQKWFTKHPSYAIQSFVHPVEPFLIVQTFFSTAWWVNLIALLMFFDWENNFGISSLFCWHN